VKPFVADVDGVPAGFADLQPDGYIDLFFVAPRSARQGVGRTLMNHILTTARQRNIRHLRSNVSLTAEPFFAKHGFLLQTRNAVQVRGQVMHNATMRLALTD
jgi:putative acetyltransferase